jgi:hypothetical protein
VKQVSLSLNCRTGIGEDGGKEQAGKEGEGDALIEEVVGEWVGCTSKGESKTSFQSITSSLSLLLELTKSSCTLDRSFVGSTLSRR